MKILNQTSDKVKNEMFLKIEVEDQETIEQVKDDVIITTSDIDTIHALYENDWLSPMQYNYFSIVDYTWDVYIYQRFKTISIKFLRHNEYQFIFSI